jgi:hypothetical protein
LGVSLCRRWHFRPALPFGMFAFFSFIPDIVHYHGTQRRSSASQ